MLEAKTARSRQGQGFMMESRIDGVRGVFSRVYPYLSVVGLLQGDLARASYSRFTVTTRATPGAQMKP